MSIRETEYSRKLADERWTEMRDSVLERDGRRCQACSTTSGVMEVHHLVYGTYGPNPWDVGKSDLKTLCRDCHQAISDAEKEIVLLVRKMNPFEAADLIATAKNILPMDELRIPGKLNLRLNTARYFVKPR